MPLTVSSQPNLALYARIIWIFFLKKEHQENKNLPRGPHFLDLDLDLYIHVTKKGDSSLWPVTLTFHEEPTSDVKKTW